MPKSNESPDTLPAAPSPLQAVADGIVERVIDAVHARLDKHEQAIDTRVDALEKNNVDRHKTLLEKWQEHEKRLNDHDTTIAQIRDGRFPVGPLWALAVIALLFAIASTSIAYEHHIAWLNVHAAPSASISR